jgi:radical SAM protein
VSPYSEAPFIVIWEMTRACDLACRHCRAAAVPMRHPDELRTEEAFALIDDLAAMQPAPLFVLTGGDPAKRPDLVSVVRQAVARGLRVSITPSATPLVTPELMAACAEAGLAAWAFSIDGPDAESHDAFRGQAGSFDLTLRAVAELRRLGLPLQVNTTVSRHNRDSLPRIGELVERLGAALWSLFFLVPTGRGRIEDALDARATEDVLAWLHGFAATSRCDVKTTEAPQWNRVLAQRGAPARRDPGPGRGRRVGRAPRPVTDGDGFIFVSHRGEVYPSGFLPVVVGNVRERPLSEIYRTAPVLAELRDRSRLRGKCRSCEFREVCGGSRARAYAVTGDYLESDPFCPHMPDPVAARRMIRLGRPA